MLAKRNIPSLIVFCLTLFCFTMPFITIGIKGCESLGSVTLTGQQLAQGTNIFSHPITPLPMAQFGAFCAIVGVLLSFFGRRVEKFLAITAAIGFTCLVLLSAAIQSDVRKESTAFMGINVKFEQGYYLATILLLAGAIMNAAAATRTQAISSEIPALAD